MGVVEKGLVILRLLLLSSFVVYSLCLIEITNAQSASGKPDWAIPGVTFSYGWQLFEYFPSSNLSSAISSMEKEFTIGSGLYTPKGRWDSIFNLKLISADSQQGVFEASVGDQKATLNYVWSSQKWLKDGQQSDFLPIYFSPEQLAGNPLITIGTYQAYKVSRLSSTNRTLYEYYQKDTGILLLMISVAIGPTNSDLIVIGLISTNIQVIMQQPQLQALTLSSIGVSPTDYSAPTTPPVEVKPGSSFRMWYYIDNPNSYSVDVVLGATIRDSNGREIYDKQEDIRVTVAPGKGWYSRYFKVPSDASSGLYDVAFAIWSPDYSTRSDIKLGLGYLRIVFFNVNLPIVFEVSCSMINN